jgi:hypothetical protein
MAERLGAVFEKCVSVPGGRKVVSSGLGPLDAGPDPRGRPRGAKDKRPRRRPQRHPGRAGTKQGTTVD